MIERFEIIDHDSPRPEAERILLCDGTGGKLFHAKESRASTFEFLQSNRRRLPGEIRLSL
jgi:hypothetical protein